MREYDKVNRCDLNYYFGSLEVEIISSMWALFVDVKEELDKVIGLFDQSNIHVINQHKCMLLFCR